MAEEAKARRRALFERIAARRKGKEAELERRKDGEVERCSVDADLTRLEELESEVQDPAILLRKNTYLRVRMALSFIQRFRSCTPYTCSWYLQTSFLVLKMQPTPEPCCRIQHVGRGTLHRVAVFEIQL